MVHGFAWMPNKILTFNPHKKSLFLAFTVQIILTITNNYFWALRKIREIAETFKRNPLSSFKYAPQVGFLDSISKPKCHSKIWAQLRIVTVSKINQFFLNLVICKGWASILIMLPCVFACITILLIKFATFSIRSRGWALTQ